MASARPETVESVLKRTFKNDTFISSYRPSYLKNKVQRIRKGKNIQEEPTHRQLSISFFCERLRFGVFCTSIPSSNWHEVSNETLEYFKEVDDYKIKTCRDNGDYVYVLPFSMENAYTHVATAWKQFLVDIKSDRDNQ